jgi:hypothetical protein
MEEFSIASEINMDKKTQNTSLRAGVGGASILYLPRGERRVRETREIRGFGFWAK